jgi:hypothetical protein
MITNKGLMRTPVILVAGQQDTDPVVGALFAPPGPLSSSTDSTVTWCTGSR